MLHNTIFGATCIRAVCSFKCSSLTTMHVESPETAGEETEAPVPMEPPTTLRTHNVYNFGQNSFGNSVGSPCYYPPYTTGYYPPYCCPTPETANGTYRLRTTTSTPAKEGGHHEPESSGSSASTTNGFPTDHYTVALKVICPENKRDYQQHSLRNIKGASTLTGRGHATLVLTLQTAKSKCGHRIYYF